jgi:hypothetical protein
LDSHLYRSYGRQPWQLSSVVEWCGHQIEGVGAGRSWTLATDRSRGGGEVMVRFVAAVLFFIASGYSVGAQQPGEIEILSKADAARLFGLSRAQWAQEVRRAVVTGAAEQTPGGDLHLVGMFTTTADGDLLTVRLDYSQGDKRPGFIQVVVGYKPERATQFDGQNLDDLIAGSQRQMAPEFDVIGKAERIGGGLALFFTILEKTRR